MQLERRFQRSQGPLFVIAIVVAAALLTAVTVFSAQPADAHSGKFDHDDLSFEDSCPDDSVSNGASGDVNGRALIGCTPVGYAPIGDDVALCDEALGMFVEGYCTFDGARDCETLPNFTFALGDGQCLRLALVAEEFAPKPVITIESDPPIVAATRFSTVVITLDYTMHVVDATDISLSTEPIDGASVEYEDSTCGGEQFAVIGGSVFSTSNRIVPAGETCSFTLRYAFAESGRYDVRISDLVSTILTGTVASDPASGSIRAVMLRECDGKSVTIDMNIPGVSGVGTAGDDVILGTIGDDVIDGGAGDDTVCAREGDDVVIGGEGADKLIGGAGRDIMRGNAGVDVLDGGPGPDRLLGGIDGDTLNGGDGDDFLGGFGGGDTINGGGGDDVIFGGFGADVINAGDGDDEVHGLIGDDTINGGAGNDQLDGDRGSDIIGGGPGDDVIRGGNAGDTLNGNAGADSVSGGKADDLLSGGPDTGDVCIGNAETIADFADFTCETIFGVP